ncbi:MAG: monofunctional biosynthetic peptidoglycan transglycosylase [Acidobacteriota bacterium]
MNRSKSKKKKKRGRRILVLVGAALALYGLWQLAAWPKVGSLVEKTPTTTAFIERYETNHDAEAQWTPVPYAAISPHLKRAVLVAEDIEFFSHNGFAHREIAAALEQAWQEKAMPRGASTISQQLVKNLYLSPSRNPLRKIKEALLTRQLEGALGKHRILELYLNVVEFGPGIYGAEAAARHYFGMSAAALSPRQGAMLAASLSRPSTWNPSRSSRGYSHRIALIERRMGKAKFLWNEI